MSIAGDYSEVADRQLDTLEAGADIELYDAVLDACDLTFRMPDRAQSLSTATSTADGIRIRWPVAGHPPSKVFWSSDDPRIEAAFRQPPGRRGQ